MNEGIVDGVNPALWVPSQYENPIDDPEHPFWQPNRGFWDYEFDNEIRADANDLPAGAIWTSKSTSTYAEHFGMGALTIPNTGGDVTRSITWMMPAQGPMTITAKYNLFPEDPPRMGFCFFDGSTKHTAYYRVGGATCTRYYTSGSNVGTGTNAALATQYLNVGWKYHRWVYASASSVTYQLSPNGAHWYTHANAENISGHMTPTQFGLFGNSQSWAGTLQFSWIRIRPGLNVP
jgi:hypothetical protein